MRVLHTINSLGTGGAEKGIIDTLPLYKKRGVKVDLLLLNGTKTPFFKELEKTPEVDIYRIGNGSLFNPLLIFRIIPFMKKYEVVHAHLFPAFYWTALAKILSGSKAKLIVTKHTTSNRRMDYSWGTKKVEKWMLNRYARIVSISPEVDSVMKEYLQFPSDKFSLIEKGVDLTMIGKAEPSSEVFFGVKDDKERILIQVSSFRTPKDQRTVIKALALLPQNVKLLLVGDGPQRADCEKLTEELHVADRVKFLGTRTDVPQLLKASDILIQSTGFEGLCMAIVEGMAAGKPVVASDVPGVRRVVSGAGLFFPFGDEKTLAKNILELLTNQDQYRQVASACLERSKKYDINSMVQNLIALYHEVHRA